MIINYKLCSTIEDDQEAHWLSILFLFVIIYIGQNNCYIIAKITKTATELLHEEKKIKKSTFFET
jgi:hypothetical protein